MAAASPNVTPIGSSPANISPSAATNNISSTAAAVNQQLNGSIKLINIKKANNHEHERGTSCQRVLRMLLRSIQIVREGSLSVNHQQNNNNNNNNGAAAGGVASAAASSIPPSLLMATTTTAAAATAPSSLKFTPDKKYQIIFKFKNGKPFVFPIEKSIMNPHEIEINLKTHMIFPYTFMERNFMTIIVRAKKSREILLRHMLDLDFLMQMKFSGKMLLKSNCQKNEVNSILNFDFLENISIERSKHCLRDSLEFVQEESYQEHDESELDHLADHYSNDTSDDFLNDPIHSCNNTNNRSIETKSPSNEILPQLPISSHPALYSEDFESAAGLSNSKLKKRVKIGTKKHIASSYNDGMASDTTGQTNVLDQMHICAWSGINDKLLERLKISLSSPQVHRISERYTMKNFTENLRQTVETSKDFGTLAFNSSLDAKLLSKFTIHIIIFGNFHHITNFIHKFIDSFGSLRLKWEQFIFFYPIIPEILPQDLDNMERILNPDVIQRSSKSLLDKISQNISMSSSEIRKEFVNYITKCKNEVNITIGNVVLRNQHSNDTIDFKFFVGVDIIPADSSSSSDDSPKRDHMCDVIVEYYTPVDQTNSKSQSGNNIKNTMKKRSHSISCFFDIAKSTIEDLHGKSLYLKISHHKKQQSHVKLMNFKRSHKKSRSLESQSNIVCTKVVFRPNKSESFSAFIDGEEFNDIKYMQVSPNVLQRIKHVQLRFLE